jgi:hypothetical protein
MLNRTQRTPAFLYAYPKDKFVNTCYTWYNLAIGLVLGY